MGWVYSSKQLNIPSFLHKLFVCVCVCVCVSVGVQTQVKGDSIFNDFAIIQASLVGPFFIFTAILIVVRRSIVLLIS